MTLRRMRMAPAFSETSGRWQYPARLPRTDAGSASPSCSALAVRGHRSGTGYDRDRTCKEVPSLRSPRGRYLSSRMGNTDACVMNPAREVVVIGLLTDASEIGGECAAFQLVAMFHGMAGHTTARLKEFLAMSCITGFLF